MKTKPKVVEKDQRQSKPAIQPDMVVVYKEKKTAFMLNVAIPADISKKEHKKMDKKK